MAEAEVEMEGGAGVFFSTVGEGEWTSVRYMEDGLLPTNWSSGEEDRTSCSGFPLALIGRGPTSLVNSCTTLGGGGERYSTINSHVQYTIYMCLNER